VRVLRLVRDALALPIKRGYFRRPPQEAAIPTRLPTPQPEFAGIRMRSRVWILLVIAATVTWLPGVLRADEASRESAGSASWWGATVNLSRPLGDFDPAGDTPQIGFGAHVSFQPGQSLFGMRLEFGSTSSETTVDSVLVNSLPGFTSYESVTAGNDLFWILIGAQWDPRPRNTSVYAFTSLGVLHVSPHGVAGSGPTIHPEVPGLPPSSMVFAYDVGLGSRLVMGKRFGLDAEVEYLYGAAADYVGSPGVEGSSPTGYASRNSPVGLFIVRLGIARLR